MTTIMVWVLMGQLTSSSYSSITVPGIASQAECLRLANAMRLRNPTCTQYQAAAAAASGPVAGNYLLAE